MTIFDKFLSKSGKHPLASADGLREALAMLPVATPKEALRKAVDILESLDNPQLNGTQKSEILLSLDAAVHGCQAQLWPHLQDVDPEQLGFIGARRTLMDYAAAFSQQVEHLIGPLLRHRDALLNENDAELVLAGRSLRALAGWKRLRHRDEETIQPEMWARLLMLLRFGFQYAVVTRAVRFYPDEPPATLQHEFLRAVMLDTLPLENLTWRQIEIMNAVLEHYSEHFLLRAEPGQLTPYFLDLSHNDGPQHASRTTPPPGAIFVGPGGAFPEIVQLHKLIAADRGLPEWLMPLDCKPVEVIKALSATVRHWSRTPPERKSGRRHGSGPLRVVQGFQATHATLEREQRLKKSSTTVFGYQANNPIFATLSMNKVAPPAPAKTKNDLVETWEMLDESSTGIGAVPALKPGRLMVGALLGCFRTHEQQWQLAVTRRTSRDSKHRFLVGMQFIAGTPSVARIGVRALPAGSPLANNNIDWRDAIALPYQNRVLFERNEFVADTVALLQFGDQGKELYIQLTHCEEAYADCDCWTFAPATEHDWDTTPPPTVKPG